MNVPRRIGILAGGGTLPREIADSVAARGMPLHIVAIDSEANADFGPYPVTRVDWGQIGRMVAALRQNACTDLVIIGSVRRPDLGAIKPDFGFFRALATVARLVAAGGDDAVLRGVIRFFEGYGFRVVGPARLAPEIIIGEGPFGRTALTPADRADAQRGFEAVAALSTFDIGQAVVVTDGRVEAFEAAEGTDRMLARVAVQRRQSGQTQGGGRGVLVKRAKPTQDERIDLPAIGPATITGCVEAGFSGLALEAGRVLAAGRQEIMERAEACRFAIEGVVPETTAVVRRRRRRQSLVRRMVRHVERWRHGDGDIQQIGNLRVPVAAEADIAIGFDVLAAMAPFADCRAVVVVRGHVLAVDCGEGALAVVRRAAGLRQWGDRRFKRRAGTVVLSAGRHSNPEVMAAAAAAGFAGLVVGLKRFTAGVAADTIGVANKAGMFIAGVVKDEEGGNAQQ